MSKSMASVDVESCILNQQETAKKLGMCADTFKGKLSQLLKEGFPKRDNLLRGWNRRAVTQWVDDRANCVTKIHPRDNEDTIDDEECLENWDEEDEG